MEWRAIRMIGTTATMRRAAARLTRRPKRIGKGDIDRICAQYSVIVPGVSIENRRISSFGRAGLPGIQLFVRLQSAGRMTRIRPLMKLKSTVVIMALGVGLLAGCGDSSKTDAPPAASGATAPSAADELKKAAADVTKEVTAEVKKQANEAAATVQKEATAAYQNVSSQLVSSFQSSSDSLLKNISSDLGSRVAKLGDSLKTNETVKAQLTSAVQSLLGKKDSDAVSGFGQVTESKLTPEQSALAKDVYNAAAALVTQRNFSSLDGMNSEVSSLVNSVWKGNYSEALPPLQKIWTQAKLTDSQKNLLGTTFDKYAPGWRDSAATLQKGVDALKSFSK